jgi:hypothetical protein
MTRINTVFLSALLLGTAAVTAPAFAEGVAAPAAPQNRADVAAPSASSAVVPRTGQSPQAQAALQAIADAQKAQQAAPQVSAEAAPTTQMAASDTSSQDIGAKSAANANVDAVGDTSKKYSRSQRSADFAKEQSVTAQLNQQAAAAAAPTSR